MNFVDKLKEQLVIAKERAIAEIKEDLQKFAVDDNVRDERMAICNSCEFLFEPTMQCKKCGCFVKAKTRFKSFSCPIGKWKEVD